MSDMVNEPPHYTAGAVECIDAIESALGPDGFRAYLRGQIIKYTWRGAAQGRRGAGLREGGVLPEAAHRIEGGVVTEQQIAEARALCERASEGPWEVYEDAEGMYTEVQWVRESDGADFTICNVQSFDRDVRMEDAAFISAARTLVPALLDALDGARSGALLRRGEIGALRGMVEERDAEIARLRRGLEKIAHTAGSPHEHVSDRDAQLLRTVVGALARIYAHGNPLAHMTPEEIEAANNPELDEIIGAWPDSGEQVEP